MGKSPVPAASARSATASSDPSSPIQQTGASGADNFGSTKGIDAPVAASSWVSPYAGEVQAGLQAARTLPAAHGGSEVALVVWISAQELPGEIAGGQVQQVAIGCNVEWPDRADIVAQAGHEVTTKLIRCIRLIQNPNHRKAVLLANCNGQDRSQGHFQSSPLGSRQNCSRHGRRNGKGLRHCPARHRPA